MKAVLGMMVVFSVALASGCATTEELKRVERKVDETQANLAALDRQVQNLAGQQQQLENAIKGTEDSLSENIRALINSKASAADVATSHEALMRSITGLSDSKADRVALERMNREKFSVEDLEKLGLDELRRRLTSVEYEMRTQREELLTGASTGYRNAVKAARECVVEIEPAISRIISGKEAACSVFIRDFRGLDDKVSVLGDLLSRDFTSFMKARSGLDRSLYREEYVIGLYQQKKLQVPAKEAFNLEYLEKGGFPAGSVLVISGRLTSTAQAYRLDIEAIDLKDPQFRASAYRLIPKDADINQMSEQVLR